jgi:hypothetical protein
MAERDIQTPEASMTAIATTPRIAPRFGAAVLTLVLALAMVAGYKAALAHTAGAVQATLVKSAHLT